MPTPASSAGTHRVRPSCRPRASLLLFATLVACEGSTPPASPSVAALEIAPSAVRMLERETRALSVVARTAGGDPIRSPRLVWSVRDPQVASVSQGGVLTALGAGATEVSANANGVSAVAAITVQARPVALVAVSPATSTLRSGEVTTLRARAFDNTGREITTRPVRWSSSDLAVATVSPNGTVSGVTAGVATITATIDGVGDAAAVTVRPPPVTRVVVTPASGSLMLREQLRLTASPRDDRGRPVDGCAVSWTSSEDRVASVAADGVVTAHRFGKATIMATCQGIQGTSTITVSPISF